MSNTDRTYTTKCEYLSGKLNYHYHVDNPAKQLSVKSVTQIMMYQNSLTNMPICLSGNLVVNGDFALENTDVLLVRPQGWDITDDEGFNYVPAGFRPPGAPLTTQALRLANKYKKSYLTQSIPTVKGVTYTLSYWLFNNGSVGLGPWDSSANLIYFSASVLGDNTPIGAVTSFSYPTFVPVIPWTKYTSTFVAISNATLLTFTSQQPAGAFLLSSISVSCQS
jgi:hypothetical protein